MTSANILGVSIKEPAPSSQVANLIKELVSLTKDGSYIGVVARGLYKAIGGDIPVYIDRAVIKPGMTVICSTKWDNKDPVRNCLLSADIADKGSDKISFIVHDSGSKTVQVFHDDSDKKRRGRPIANIEIHDKLPAIQEAYKKGQQLYLIARNLGLDEFKLRNFIKNNKQHFA